MSKVFPTKKNNPVNENILENPYILNTNGS